MAIKCWSAKYVISHLEVQNDHVKLHYPGAGPRFAENFHLNVETMPRDSRDMALNPKPFQFQ